MKKRSRILAIDGALNKSGWVVLDDLGGEGLEGIKSVKYGIIKPNPKMELGFKLAFLKQELTKLYKNYRPTAVVFENMFVGNNKLTSARLNNAKGVYILTIRELTGHDPVFVFATEARTCLGFKPTKEGPFDYFKKRFKLTENFKEGNDITDAFAIGFWYIVNDRGDCQEKPKKRKKNGKRGVKSKNAKKK